MSKGQCSGNRTLKKVTRLWDKQAADIELTDRSFIQLTHLFDKTMHCTWKIDIVCLVIVSNQANEHGDYLSQIDTKTLWTLYPYGYGFHIGQIVDLSHCRGVPICVLLYLCSFMKTYCAIGQFKSEPFSKFCFYCTSSFLYLDMDYGLSLFEVICLYFDPLYEL